MSEQAIEALPINGETWVELARWEPESNAYDADGWLDAWGERVGKTTARLPNGGWVDLSHFAAVRASTDLLRGGCE